METALAVFVPRSKRWWTSSRRRRSGYHSRAFRENHSQILHTFVNSFNFSSTFSSFLLTLRGAMGLSGKIGKVSFILFKLLFPFFLDLFRLSWDDLSFLLRKAVLFLPVEKLIILKENPFDLIFTPFIRILSRSFLGGRVLV